MSDKYLVESCMRLESETAALRDKLDFQTKQGADRLIGLCKCGLERDELRRKLAEQQAQLKAVCDKVETSFHGYEIDKLPEILISLSAKLFGQGGIFWETTIDLMPARLQVILDEAQRDIELARAEGHAQAMTEVSETPAVASVGHLNEFTCFELINNRGAKMSDALILRPHI